VITAVVTLLVAAIAVLPRLESLLRDASLNTLRSDVTNAASQVEQIEGLPYTYAAKLEQR